MEAGQEQLVQLEDEEDELIELLLWVGALESTGYVINQSFRFLVVLFGAARRNAPFLKPGHSCPQETKMVINR